MTVSDPMPEYLRLHKEGHEFVAFLYTAEPSQATYVYLNFCNLSTGQAGTHLVWVPNMSPDRLIKNISPEALHALANIPLWIGPDISAWVWEVLDTWGIR